MACHLRGSISDEHSAFLAVICHGHCQEIRGNTDSRGHLINYCLTERGNPEDYVQQGIQSQTAAYTQGGQTVCTVYIQKVLVLQ